MKRLVLGIVAVMCGCSSNASYTVNHQSLSVKDTGYVSTDGRYCQGADAGQFRLVLVDYSPICGPNIGIDADGGAREAQLEHNELEIIFATSGHDPKLPYAVPATNDCTNGPAGPVIVNFYHYDAESDTPTVTPAVGGQAYLTFVDPTGAKPATGSFDLDFGAGGKVKGDFKTYTCN